MYKLIINLKTYGETTNKGCIKIIKAVNSLKKEAKKKDVEIILSPQFFDIKDCIKDKVAVYAQHIDPVEPGRNTGLIVPGNLRGLGVSGTIISHSEHILSLDDIKSRIEIAKKSKLISVVCSRNLQALKKIVKLKPDYVAVEPKELIGGDISISSANPKLIEDSVKAAGKVPVIVGAGVRTSEDVRVAIELGAMGILLASEVAKSKNPKKTISDLISGF